MDIREIKTRIKSLPRKDRRKIRMRCAEEALGSWPFVTAVVLGIPCVLVGGATLSKFAGNFGEYSFAFASAVYAISLSAILSRQGDCYLKKAYEELQSSEQPSEM